MLRKDLMSLSAGIAGAAAFGALADGTPALALSQNSSDADVFLSRGRVAGAIVALQNLATDYQGNRQTAIDALKQAESQLTAALASRTTLDQHVSDEVVRIMARDMGSIIGRLQQDLGDYGGNKSGAISSLQTAQNALNAALNSA